MDETIDDLKSKIQVLIKELEPKIVKRIGLGARTTKWCGHLGNIVYFENHPELVQADTLIQALTELTDVLDRAIKIANKNLGKASN